MKYRPEVAGLCAVAVVPVILFHANPSLLSAGQLGANIFSSSRVSNMPDEMILLPELLCRGQACRAYVGTMPLAHDYGHLTHAGAALVAGELVAHQPRVWRGVMP